MSVWRSSALFVVKSREDRFRASSQCLLDDSGDQTVSLAVRSREKIVARASLGERSELAGGKTKGVRALTKGQRDKNTQEQWEHRPWGVSGTEGCPGVIKEATASQEMSEGKASGVVRRVWSGTVLGADRS